MELKISCDASVKLKKMNGIKNVNCTVHNYEKNKDTLTGNIKIAGKYIRDNLEEEYDFSELVPFTVVFRDENFKLNNISCQNFTFNQIVNQGLECHFDILIDYTKHNLEEAELDVDFSEMDTNENIIKEVKDLEKDEKISEKYDEMLQDILSKRNDNFLEELESEEVIASIEDELLADLESELIGEKTDVEAVKGDVREIEASPAFSEEIVEEIPVEVEEEPLPVTKENKFGVTISGNSAQKEGISQFAKSFPEKYDVYKVYYLQNENEVDKVCQHENISIGDAYEEFHKYKRIIIK